MSDAKTIKDQIGGLWNDEARQIMAARREREQQADALRRSYAAVLSAIEEADRLRAQADALLGDFNKASIAKDRDRADELQRRYRDLMDEADSVEENASGAARTLREAGVEGEDRETLEAALEARLIALEGQSREEVELLEKVGREAQALLTALLERSEPFVRSIPAGAEKRQASGYVLQRV